MFGLFKKDPLKALTKKYAELTEDAMHAQRRGDIEGYSKLTSEAEALYKEIEDLKAKS